VIEDGTGQATFTAHRTGSGTVISEPLVVSLKDAGTGLADAAGQGTDYQPINEIVIPAGQNDGSVDVVPINDDEAEDVESIYQSVAAKPVYLLAEAPATAPATNATTQKANIDDDITVKSILVYRSAPYENTGSHNDAFGFDFWDTVEIHGEHLDKVLVQQMIKSSTQLTDWNGQNLSRAQVLDAYGGSPMAAVDSDGSFVLDTGWSWAHLPIVPGTHNGIAKENDHQAHQTQTKHAAVPSGIVEIGMVMTVTRDFQIWTVTDLFSPLLDIDWGYSWTNAGARWPAADNPPEPSCVSTDFGTGVFSNVKTITGLPW
jgi:hypothetical protein